MKRNRAKLNVGQRQIPPYEMQRLENLRLNEEKMKAKGFGSLANKSLLNKTQEILSGWRDDEIFSSEDEYFTSDYEGYDEDNETNNDARQHTMEVENEGVKHPSSQPLSMRDFVHKNGQRNQRAKDTQSENVEQNKRKSMVTAQPAKQKMIKDIARPQKQQPKGKTQEKEYCIPGSISSFRLFRQKQLEKRRHITDKESPITNEMTQEANLEIQIPSIITGHGEAEHELEQQPINEEIQLESQPNERIEEACKSKKQRGPTTLTKVHSRTKEEREPIVLNSIGQPVGPTKEVVDEFSLFLGTVARDSELAPLNYRNFKHLPTLDKIWDYVLAKMDALQSENGEDGHVKDHYSQVIQDPVRKNRVRLYGRGVTKTDLKKKDKNSGFIFPQEFLQSMETQLVQKLAPSVASVILSQIQAANPGVDLVIPDFSSGTIPRDASRDQQPTSDSNGQASNGPQLLDREVPFLDLISL
ncbi:hypothetical protein BVRB_7g161190 [Beta vulgaris subsp. vulgaris]|nr:hypothetical protein BVRB_7g161190 [Beta vulgaris subsp. vulgaris]